MSRSRLAVLSMWCLLSLSMACATARPASPFDPTAFLKTMTPTGEGNCRLSNGHQAFFYPCKSFESTDGVVYIALYHPTLGYLLSIKELRIDGTQSSVWNRPTPAQVVPAKRGTTT
jgi:hypothetical protein